MSVVLDDGSSATEHQISMAYWRAGRSAAEREQRALSMIEGCPGIIEAKA